MTQMHQLVILTTHEISNEGLMAIFKEAMEHASPAQLGPQEVLVGTAFKLANTVDVPDDETTGLVGIGAQYLEPIFGKFAP